MICRGGSEWLYLILMWIPALAATVANCISFRENREPFSAKKLLAKGGFRKCKLRYVLLACLLPLVYLLIPYIVYWRLYNVLCQRDRRTHDSLRLGIGGNLVHTRKETRKVSVKRTHTHINSAYIKPEYSCKI